MAVFDDAWREMQEPTQPAQTPCRWCGALHGPMCTWVKALEFENVDGVERVTRVEFFAPRDYLPERKEAEEPPPGDYPKLGSIT